MTAMAAPPGDPDRDRDGDSTGGSGGDPDGGLDGELAARRWRMILGRYAESALPREAADAGLDDALGHLYDREYTGRGHRLGRGGPDAAGRGDSDGDGGLGPSALRTIDWLEGPVASSPPPPWSAWSPTP